MPIAIATMVYNERVNLPIWIRHDRAQCPGAHLVIDHGSDDGSTDGLADVTVITLPRTPLDEAGRVRIVEGVQRDLLLDHAVVICTDCDEILLADPQRHASLAAFLDAVPDDFIAPAGVHVLHDFETEPALDPSAPILAQRRFVEFGSGMCKPMIGRVPLAWDVGFHGSDQRPAYRPDLIHFHLGDVDRDIALHRLALTRAITWSDASLAAATASISARPITTTCRAPSSARSGPSAAASHSPSTSLKSSTASTVCWPNRTASGCRARISGAASPKSPKPCGTPSRLLPPRNG
jgi:hypothetical protein